MTSSTKDNDRKSSSAVPPRQTRDSTRLPVSRSRSELYACQLLAFIVVTPCSALALSSCRQRRPCTVLCLSTAAPAHRWLQRVGSTGTGAPDLAARYVMRIKRARVSFQQSSGRLRSYIPALRHFSRLVPRAIWGAWVDTKFTSFAAVDSCQKFLVSQSQVQRQL